VSSPIIFSAGSLSARLPPEAQGRARNQFYIVSFPLSIIAERALGLVGTFQSWDWTQGVGWEPARDNSGLPKHGGFGLRMSKENLARQVHEFWKSSGAQFMDWRRVIEKIPEIQFLLPSDLESLFRILESDFAMGRVPDDQIPPAQIGKLS
jgi:hypothetical protein